MNKEEYIASLRNIMLALARDAGLPCSSQTEESRILHFASLMFREAQIRCEWVMSHFEFQAFNNGPFYDGEIRAATHCAVSMKESSEELKELSSATPQNLPASAGAGQGT